MRARLAEEWAIFLLATQFLTRLPVRETHWSPERMAATPRWFPAVGALIGAIAGLVYLIAALVYPPGLCVLLSTATGLILTGCLHEDGFADTCDGIGGGATRDRALEIMRDSRIGSYGAAGIVLMLICKIMVLAVLPPASVPSILIAGHAASRASAVAVMASAPYVRSEGAGQAVSRGIGLPSLSFALGTASAIVAALVWILPPSAIFLGIGGLLLGHLIIRRAFEPRLGGYTGDCLGATQQVSEIGFYLGLLAWL